MFVEGYTDQLSYRADEQVRFHVATSADEYALEVTRIGAEREVVWRQDQLPGSSHPVPEDASSNGCGWPVSHSLEVPDDWRSGYYEFALHIEDQGGKFVRRGRRTAESRGFFHRPPGWPYGRSYPPPASHQYLQRLQQLGRLQLVQLSRPRRLAGASRLLRPSNGRAVRPLGARLCRVGGSRLDMRSTTAPIPTSNGIPNCWTTTGSCSAWGTMNTGRLPCATTSKPTSPPEATPRFSAATPCAGGCVARTRAGR